MDRPRKLERRSSKESLMKQAAPTMKQAAPTMKKASLKNPLKELNSSRLQSRFPRSAPPNRGIAAAGRYGNVSRNQFSQKVESKSNLDDSNHLASRTNTKPSMPDPAQRLKKKKNPSSVSNKPKEKCDFGNATPKKILSLGFTDNVTFPAAGGGGEKVTGTPTPATTTPPIETSISPEVPIGSPLVPGISACFAAGHVIAKVHYRRKCRPRGILTVGRDPKLLHCNGDSARASFTPEITEASMHWINSPKDEFFCTNNSAMGEKDFVDDELWRFSPTSGGSTSPFSMILERVANASTDKHGSALQSSTYSGISSVDGTTCTVSPSLRSEKRGTQPLVKKDSILEILGDVSLSPELDTSDQSFQFDCHHPQVLDSVEFKHFQKARITWQEGLISQTLDLSELDFSNWLSDGKDSLNDIQDKKLESKGFGSIEFTYDTELHQNRNPKVLPAAQLQSSN